MSTARAADLHLIEIDLGLVDRLDAVGAATRRFKRDLRNAVWRWRRGGGFRSHSRFCGFSGIILVGGRWRLVARLVGDLNGAAAGPLMDRLRRVWPSAKVQPVADPTGTAMACWPDFTSWTPEALNWLNLNRNQQILRVSIRPAGERVTMSARAGVGQRTADAWSTQPLPCVF